MQSRELFLHCFFYYLHYQHYYHDVTEQTHFLFTQAIFTDLLAMWLYIYLYLHHMKSRNVQFDLKPN